jgi:hypothetical protein
MYGFSGFSRDFHGLKWVIRINPSRLLDKIYWNGLSVSIP